MICAITSYYNPLGWKSRLENYKVFRKQLHSRLVTVELTLPDQKPVIDDAIQLKSPDILWQKERLLNVALENLPPDCTAVAWIDADLVWEQDWQPELEHKLQDHDLIQLFSSCYRDQEGIVEVPISRGGTSRGLAWAARREDLEQIQFFDICVLGGGDSAFYYGCKGIEDTFPINHMSPSLKAGWLQWSLKARETFKKIDCLELECKHLFHGFRINRSYKSRWLKLSDFDPKCLMNVGGAWRWNDAGRKKFAARFHEYFVNRQEDA